MNVFPIVFFDRVFPDGTLFRTKTIDIIANHQSRLVDLSILLGEFVGLLQTVVLRIEYVTAFQVFSVVVTTCDEDARWADTK